MEESALGITNNQQAEANLQKTKVFLSRLIDMLNDQNVSLEDIFQFIASRTPGVTAKDVEHDVRSRVASTYTDLLNLVVEDLLKVSNKLAEKADAKE